MGVLYFKNCPPLACPSGEVRRQRGARQAKRQHKHRGGCCNDSHYGPAMVKSAQGILVRYRKNHYHQQHNHENVNEIVAADRSDLDLADIRLGQQTVTLNAQ